MTPRQKVDIQNALTEKHGGDRDKALNEFFADPSLGALFFKHGFLE